MAPVPGRGDALEVGRQSVGVADQRDALTVSGQPAGLLHGQEGLAAAGTAADLDAVNQLDRVQDDGLVFGENICGVFVFSSARATTLRCGRPRPLSASFSWAMPSRVSIGRSSF